MGYSISMTELSLRVLRRLADGEYHSGTTLARELGISRGTIWNAVRLIERQGLTVARLRGRGYRLARRLSMLDRATILHYAGAAAPQLAVDVIDVVDSTNTLLLQRAAGGAPSGSVIAAECQRNGRGRMGRQWHASVGGALTFSILWRFDAGASALAGLSLAAGVALMRAFAQLGAGEARLKWPNDVVWRGRKVAGVLVEMQGDALGPSAVVIGVGLNIRLSRDVTRSIEQPAADLETLCGRELERSVVLGTILHELVPALRNFERDGFAAVREEWQRWHAHQHCEVIIRLPSGETQSGVARGVADTGALLFERGGDVRHLHSAEVSLRETATDAVSTVRVQPGA
jgi:BirA family transcriptional regulator, biotin operon repressor / biotin---[acetyl-CoA-carboxylase] ligase